MENTTNNTTNSVDGGQVKPEPEKEKVVEKIKEVHHHHYGERGLNLGRLFLGLLFIFVGVIFLGNTTGWFNIKINIDWNLIWALFIVFIGLSLLSRRGWVSAVLGTLVVIVVLAVAAVMIFGSSFGLNSYQDINQDISINKEVTAKSADITVKIAAGNLNIIGGQASLVSGGYKSGFTRIDTSSAVENGVQKIALNAIGQWHVLGIGGRKNELNLTVNQNLPMVFNIETGAIAMNLDLNSVVVKEVNVKTGASSLDLDLGDKLPLSKVNINAGASSINIKLPTTVGVQIKVNSGLSSTNLNNFAKVSDNLYQSANYNTALKKIEINADIGVSSLNVGWGHLEE